jgi:hypothetical protein
LSNLEVDMTYAGIASTASGAAGESTPLSVFEAAHRILLNSGYPGPWRDSRGIAELLERRVT